MSHAHSCLTRSSLGFLFALCAVACSSNKSSDSPVPDPDSGVSQPSTDDTSSAPGVTDSTDATQLPTSAPPPTTEAPTEPDAGNDSEPADGGTSGEPTSDGGDQTEPTSPADGGVLDPWASCPTTATPKNDAWPIRVRASEDAIYCAMFNETRTLAEEQATKLQLRIAPGVHRVPDVDTEAFALPACIRDESEAKPVVAGAVTVMRSPAEGNTDYSLRFDQEFGERDARHLQISLQQTIDDGATVEFVVDGTEGHALDAYQAMDLCEDDGDSCFPTVLFTSCAYESGELNTHEVAFEGGNVTFALRLGESFAGTEPGAFVSAHGTYLGEAFVQDDYFKLIYHPTHHHFERAFVVLFDAPRGDVCGIEVSGLEPFGDDVPDVAFAVDCELQRLDELAVEGHTLTRDAR